MKKLFRIFVLLFAFVPCALLLTACGGDEYDRAKNETNFKSAVEKTSTLGENFTITTSSTQSGVFADEVEPMAEDEGSTTIKMDNGNYFIESEEQTTYTIDGVSYVMNSDGSITATNAEGSSLMSFDMSGISDETLQGFIDYAFSTDDEAIKTNGSSVSININFSKYLNDFITVVRETEASENDTLADVINNYLARYEITLPTIGESDAVTGQGQIENFLDEMDNLTVQEICDYVETNMSVDVVSTIKVAMATTYIFSDAEFTSSQHTSTSEAIQYAIADFDFDMLNEMLALELSDMVEMLAQTINPEIDFGTDSCFGYVKDFLTSNSLSYLLAKESTASGEPTLVEILETKEMINIMASYIKFNKLNLTLSLTTEGEQFTGADIAFAVEITMLGEKIEGSTSFSFEFSEIGSTVVALPSITQSTIVDVATMFIIDSSMVLNGEITLSNISDNVLSTFFADGIEIKSDDGTTTLVTITKNSSANNFTIALSDEVIAELFAAGSEYNLVKVTKEVGNKTLTLTFVVDNSTKA